jgi:hypothetical protein
MTSEERVWHSLEWLWCTENFTTIRNNCPLPGLLWYNEIKGEMMSTKFTPEELEAFKTELCKGASDAQFQLFIAEAEARDLRPGVHLFFQLRNTSEWDPDVRAKVRVAKATWITTIAALRLISQRTGKDEGRGKTRWIYLDSKNAPTIESTIPLPHPDNPQLPREPYACVVPIYRKDYREPVEVVCRFDAYAVTVKTDNGPVLTEMWSRRGPEQLEKCTEASTRRATYPESLGSLYLAEEFRSEEEEKPHAVTPASVVPLPPPVPAVNQKPAEPTNSPRPGESKTGLPDLTPLLERHPREVIHPVPVPETPTAVPDVPVPENVNQKVAKAVAAVPDLKPASEIPAPKKRGRKPKNPDNGRDLAAEGEITDRDIALAGTPAPEINTEENRVAAQEFVESITEFTVADASAQGLPAPPDPLPDDKQRSEFVTRMRALVEPGVDIKTLGDYTLGMTADPVRGIPAKTGSKYLTVGDWTKAFAELDKAKAAGTLKELLKGKEQPLGQF